MKNMNAKNPKRNEGGFITLDFIFALMLSVGFAVIFFSVSITLSLVETAQYVTFASARAFAAAHETEQAQKDLGQAKYDEIMAKRTFKTFLSSDWMKISPPNLGDFYSEYPNQAGGDDNTFVGAQITIDAKLLHLNVPFVGKTTENPNVGKATLNAYLMREVSTTECRENFNRARYDQLKNLGYGAPGGAAKLITDNGC